ncbi:MAG: HAD family hydrolase [Opitutales bacterium]
MTAKPPIKTVLYDLDGTLVDNFQAIYASYCHALEQLGLAPVSYDTLKATVGGSVPITMAKLIGEEQAREAVPHYDAYFAKHCLEGLFALPGARELVSALHKRGLRQGVFTNKSGCFARKIVKHLGWADAFAGVFGAEDTAWRKPQPAFTRHVIEQLGIDPATTLMIGDSPFDIAAARAGDLRVAVVGTGSHTVEQLATEEADGVYPDMPGLARAWFPETLRT